METRSEIRSIGIFAKSVLSIHVFIRINRMKTKECAVYGEEGARTLPVRPTMSLNVKIICVQIVKQKLD
jgi:hypothetical protein